MLRGFDKDPLNQGLLLSLPMKEGTGTVTQDVARPHHPMTMGGAPTWVQLASGIWVLDFDSTNPDYLSCVSASCADLDFTTGDFSFALWVHPDDLAPMGLLARGLFEVDGWIFMKTITQTLEFRSSQAGVHQLVSASGGAVPPGRWSLVGLNRVGTLVAFMVNGGLTGYTWLYPISDPLTSACDLSIGLYPWGFDGQIWKPRIWNRCLSAADHQLIFQRERHLFGV